MNLRHGAKLLFIFLISYYFYGGQDVHGGGPRVNMTGSEPIIFSALHTAVKPKIKPKLSALPAIKREEIRTLILHREFLIFRAKRPFGGKQPTDATAARLPAANERPVKVLQGLSIPCSHIFTVRYRSQASARGEVLRGCVRHSEVRRRRRRPRVQHQHIRWCIASWTPA